MSVIQSYIKNFLNNLMIVTTLCEYFWYDYK